MTITSNTRFKTLTGIVLLAACSLVPAARVAGQGAALIQEEPGGPVYVAGDLIIQLKPNAGDADMRDVERRGALKLVKHIKTDAMKAAGHPGVSRMRTGLPVRQAIAALKNHPAVEFAEPNWVYTHTAVSNDPYYTGGQTWGLYGNLSSPVNQFGSQAGEAWGAGFIGSPDVYVGVIDEGIQFTHPDLTENVWTNPGETSEAGFENDGIDNDGNGYIDDVHGWDFFSNDNSIYDGTVDDHGTHVTGTIGATGGNGVGVAGVNWNVTYISGKFLGPNGGSTADAVEAVDYFTNLKKNAGLNLVALSNSWGGGGFSQALLDAIVRAANEDILFIAAAGNAAVNIDTTPYYPARYDTTTGAGYNSVITVAAIQSNGALASFSNYGKNSVHLGAPGVGIMSTVPNGAYASYNGTSMATPHVTGAAALYASNHPDATAFEIKNALLGSTLPTASLANTVTGGRLDLSTIIGWTGPPPAPTGVAATPADTQVTLTWNVTVAARIYEVKRSSSHAGPYSVITPVEGIRTTSYSDTGLTNGLLYYYVVSATNLSGEGPDSAEVFATPQVGPPAPPAAPSALTATAVSSSQISLTWADNSSNELGFKIEQSTNNINFTEIAQVGLNSFQVTGLTKNRQYYYRVRAHNSGGNSGYSNTATAKTPKK